MIQQTTYTFLLTIFFSVFILSCEEAETTPTAMNEVQEDSLVQLEQKIPSFKAKVDQEAMQQLTEWRENVHELDVWEQLDQSVGEYMVWSDKMWGRCCTEADMRFSEFCSYDLSTTHDYKAYPFSNALDDQLATTYVFELKDSVRISVRFNQDAAVYYNPSNTVGDYIPDDMFIHRKFQISLVNGYTKNKETWEKNARVKELELRLNGEHKCNVTLLDQPEIQIIRGNFKFYKNDVVELRPVSIYPGTEYDDVCISAIQTSLGYGANPALDSMVKY